MTVTTTKYHKSVMILLALLIPFAMVATAQAVGVTNQTAQGTIFTFQSDSGKLAVQVESGEMLILAVTPNLDMSIFKKGDKVIVEYDEDKVLQAIKLQK